MSDLNPDNIDFFGGKEFCGICRDWYSKDLTCCPDCTPVELQTGTRKVTSIELMNQIETLEAEVKKAFWAGFEISHSLGGTDIQARWNEYKKLRGME